MKIAPVFTIITILICKNLSAQIIDTSFDKFIVVNEWTGTISVKVNWTKDIIGFAVINGPISLIKNNNGRLNLMWGFDAMNPGTWNWNAVYSTNYTQGGCSYSRSDEQKSFLAALYINPVNYTYSFAFLDSPIPVDYSCPDEDKGEINTNLVYGLEVRHIKLDINNLLLKGSVTFTDVEAQQKDKEIFDSYRDTMENRLNRNRDILDSFGITIPSIEEPESNTAYELSAVTYEVTWNLVPKQENTPITLHEIDETWYPSENESVSTYVEWNQDAMPVAIRFTLFEITNEKGYCLNSQEKQETLDITFDSAWSTENHYELTNDDIPNKIIATRRSLNLTGREEVRIKSFDYGGWAKLKVELMFEDAWVPAGNVPYITIPFDNDEDKIADKWEAEYGVQALPPDWDEETGNGHIREGDGITLYEEYRGFFTLPDGSLKRTDPNIKDLFVIDNEGLFRPDVWEYSSGIMGYRVDNSMTKNEGGPKSSRIVDFNDGYAKNNNKYALRVVANKIEGFKRGNVKGTIYGFAQSNLGEHVVPNAPKDCDSTIIYTGNIRWVTGTLTIKLQEMIRNFTDEQIDNSAHMTQSQCERLYNLLSNPAAMEAAIHFYTQATLFHELGHGCSVHHHTTHNIGDYQCPMRYTDSYEDLLILEYTVIDLLEFINNFQVVDVSGIAERFKVLRFCESRFNCYSQLCVKDN